MQRLFGWTALAAAVAAVVVALGPGCGGGGAGTGVGGSHSSGSQDTSGTLGSGASGSTNHSSSGTGAGGGLSSFTSKGTSSYEAQTSIVADDKGSIVAAWIAFFADGTSSIGYAISRDGGTLWTAPAYIQSPGGRFASNPVLAIDSQSRVSLAWLGFKVDVAAPDEHIYFSQLDSTTDTFGVPTVASDDGTSTTRDFDHPSIAIDANDNVLLTWADFTGSGSGTLPSLTFARTTDGTAFTRSTIVADASFGNLASLCLDVSLGPTAPLYLVHLAAGATLTLRTSVDQGQNWQLGGAVPATQVVFQDPSCIVHGTDLTIAYATGNSAPSPQTDSPADAVNVLHSANGGTIFDTPATASLGPVGSQYLFPAFARTPSGKLEIVFYQSGTGSTASFILASSNDGTNWNNSPIGPSGDFTLDRTLASWLGDYVGLTTTATSTFTTFTDNEAGEAHVRFAKVTAP